MAKRARHIKIKDTVVIYPDGAAWVAHSLRTDQVGVGDRIVDALACLIRGIDSLIQEAKKDQTIAYLREAPAEVQRLADEAKPLPKEIHEVAHWMACGQWPAGWQVRGPDGVAATLKLEIQEAC